MKIEFLANREKRHGKLVYFSDEYSLDTLNAGVTGGISLCVNEIIFEFSEQDEAVSLWGYFPHTSWQEGEVPEPVRQPGALRLDADSPLTPGVSVRVTEVGDRWPVTFDQSSGWLHVGRNGSPYQHAVEFNDGCVVALNNGEIVGLWLHPEIREVPGATRI